MQSSKVNPLIYWHLHKVTQKELNIASNYGVYIEVDIAWDYDAKEPYIGHPALYYSDVTKQSRPYSISLSILIDFLSQNQNVGLVIDLKDKNAIQFVNYLLNVIKNPKIIHAFIKDWADPVPQFVVPEAHWQQENITLKDIGNISADKGILIGAIRGYSVDWLTNKVNITKCLQQAGGIFDSVSVYLPGAAIPPNDIIKTISNNGFLPWINVDLVNSNTFLPPKYIGMTDNPIRATKL